MRAYLYGGVALVIAALAAAMFFYRAEAASAVAKRDEALQALNRAVDVNRSLEATNTRLQEQAAINDRILLGIANELAEISDGIAEQKDAITDLKATDDEVRSYLDTPVPDALELQLNR